MPASSPPASDVPLVVQGAEKRYGEVRALAGASFEVRKGELLGLLGPNGAGKTTAIKAIAGRVKLDAGAIRLFGRPLAREDARPEIGVVPQELAVYPLMTARENLEAFGELYGVTGSDLKTRVEWALEWSDLKDRAREPTKRFSGGMKRRLNIACSLLHRPALVLADEPTVGVDPQSRERIYEMLASLRESGVSIVLTTHHLEEAEQRCERIVIIDHGRIVASGTLGELLRGTFGATRTLKVFLTTAWAEETPLPAGLRAEEGGRTIVADVRDVGRETARLLDQIAAAGAEVADVSLAGATLRDVFIALTGRELRE
jgi:ABC-2 type transport system ATP-binding protein